MLLLVSCGTQEWSADTKPEREAIWGELGAGYNPTTTKRFVFFDSFVGPAICRSDPAGSGILLWYDFPDSAPANAARR